MLINIRDITNALSKVSELTSGDKNTPGVMINLTEGVCEVCYSDGHKALVEKIDVVNENEDIYKKIVVPCDQINRAIGNCQPSGSIVVNQVRFIFMDGVVRITAEQGINIEISEGQTEFQRKATKSMDIPMIIVDETTDQKAKLLNRMNYNLIFEPEDSEVDEWDKEELIRLLNTMSVEKGRAVYFSPKLQKSYVVNTAYTCVIPISKKFEPTMEDYNELRGTLSEAGIEGTYEEKAAKLGERVHFSVCISTEIASRIANILNKLPKNNDEYEKVFIHSSSGYVAIFTSDNKVGIYSEMARPSKVHIGSFENFTSFEYTKYQLTFIREFLADSIKSAVNSSKNEKTAFTFRESNTMPGTKELIIVSSNASASVSDNYNVTLDTVLDPTNTLLSTTLTVSLKIFYEMLNSLKSTMVALDISEERNGQVFFRLAEINEDKVRVEWTKARTALNLPLEPILDQPMPETPIEVKLKYRTDTLDTCQYSIVQK